VRGLGLVLFMTVPAVCGYLVLAGPLAHAVAVGEMGTVSGTRMVTWTLTAVAVGAVGQSLFFLATQAAYATGDTRTSLSVMLIQALVCLGLCSVTLGLNGIAVLVVAGGSYTVANLVGGTILVVRLRRRLTLGAERLRPSLLRTLLGSAVMVVPTAEAGYLITRQVGGRPGWIFGIGAAALVGLTVFGLIQALLRSPELSWVARSVLSRGREPVTLTGDQA
jgi:putative peptidoglycan lipid II flippase